MNTWSLNGSKNLISFKIRTQVHRLLIHKFPLKTAEIMLALTEKKLTSAYPKFVCFDNRKSKMTSSQSCWKFWTKSATTEKFWMKSYVHSIKVKKCWWTCRMASCGSPTPTSSSLTHLRATPIWTSTSKIRVLILTPKAALQQLSKAGETLYRRSQKTQWILEISLIWRAVNLKTKSIRGHSRNWMETICEKAFWIEREIKTSET